MSVNNQRSFVLANSVVSRENVRVNDGYHPHDEQRDGYNSQLQSQLRRLTSENFELKLYIKKLRELSKHSESDLSVASSLQDLDELDEALFLREIRELQSYYFGYF